MKSIDDGVTVLKIPEGARKDTHEDDLQRNALGCTAQLGAGGAQVVSSCALSQTSPVSLNLVAHHSCVLARNSNPHSGFNLCFRDTRTPLPSLSVLAGSRGE